MAELKIALQNAADGNYEPFELAYGTKKEHINSYLDIQMTLNSMENFSSLKLKNIRVGYQIENDPAKQLKEIEVESQNQFEKDTGISTRQLLALYQLGEKKDLKKRWENQKFYLLFDETERDSEKPERNLTHDYVLVWKREDNQGVAKVSFCGFEEPLRDYVVSVSEPVLSLFGNTQVLIYGDADQQAYVAQFTIRDCYVDVECRNVSEEEFKVFLWKLTQILEDESNQ